MQLGDLSEARPHVQLQIVFETLAGRLDAGDSGRRQKKRKPQLERLCDIETHMCVDICTGRQVMKAIYVGVCVFASVREEEKKEKELSTSKWHALPELRTGAGLCACPACSPRGLRDIFRPWPGAKHLAPT